MGGKDGIVHMKHALPFAVILALATAGTFVFFTLTKCPDASSVMTIVSALIWCAGLVIPFVMIGHNGGNLSENVFETTYHKIKKEEDAKKHKSPE
jgi:hypothetical protein